MTNQETVYQRWILEGSNGEVLHGPSSFEETILVLEHFEEKLHEPYSAYGPKPVDRIEKEKATRLGYILRKVHVKVIEIIEEL